MKKIRHVIIIMFLMTSSLLAQDQGYNAESVLVHNPRYTLQLALMTGKISGMDMNHEGSCGFTFIIVNGDSISRVDSTNTKNDWVVERVFGETLFGGTAGVILAIPGGLIGNAAGGGSWAIGSALIGAYTGYIVGSSLGVYFIAKRQKENVSLLGTLTGGIVGAGAGIGIFQLSNQKGVGSFALLIMPIAASIIYAELIE